jgi:hypothetical protein
LNKLPVRLYNMNLKNLYDSYHIRNFFQDNYKESKYLKDLALSHGNITQGKKNVIVTITVLILWDLRL